MMKRAEIAKTFATLSLFAAVFVAAASLAERYRAELAHVVGQGSAEGAAAFVALTAFFVVFVIPLDVALLIPIGAATWGPLPTAFMSIAGWTLGAALAFSAARRWGARFVGKFVGIERLRAVERRIPKKNLFWSIVALRMLVSVDILSYALGLFTALPWGQYVLATALGVAPFGFYFAYAGALPLGYRIAAIFLALLLATAAFMKYGISREP